MKIYSKTHIDKIRARPDGFWKGGPPPEYEPHERLPTNAGWVFADKARAFLASLERTHSIKASKREAGMESETLSLLVERSAWFCESINRVATESVMDAKFAALARAAGFTDVDEEGQVVTDADGRVVRKGSDLLAKYIFESSERDEFADDIGPEQADFPPLLPSNIDQHRQLQIDDCRMAINAIRPAVRAGDRQAADTFVKLQDRLAKLSGTDAPKTSVSYIGGGSIHSLSDEQLEAIVLRNEEERRRGITLQQGEDGTYTPDGN